MGVHQQEGRTIITDFAGNKGENMRREWGMIGGKLLKDP